MVWAGFFAEDRLQVDGLWEVTRQGLGAGWAWRKEKQEASMRGHQRFGTIRLRRLYKSLRRAQGEQVWCRGD